jgi:four helix bundle protein
MARVANFEQLHAWLKARELTRAVYDCSRQGQFSRDFALRDQIRRAAVSVMSNIAEGFERGGDSEFIQFLAVAKGSCGEVRAQLYVALDQDYLEHDHFAVTSRLALETSKLIAGLMRYLRASDKRGSKFKS